MARKNAQGTPRRRKPIKKRSGYNRARLTLTKACLSIAAVPMLLAAPAAMARTITTITTSRQTLNGGESIIIDNSGRIFAPTVGIDLLPLDPVAGDITNDGIVLGYGSDAYGVNLVDGSAGSITNNAGGSIEANGYSYGDSHGFGVNISGSTVDSITNNVGGFIEGYGYGYGYGSGSGSGYGINIANASTISGGITNDGFIAGYGYGNNKYGYGYSNGDGIKVSGGSTVGSITNNTNGTIEGDGYYGGTGINVSGTGSSIGSITNTGGDIVGSGYYGGNGINVSGGGTVGSITNNTNGTISGYGSASGVGINVSDFSTIANITNGTTGEIRGETTGGYGYGTSIGINVSDDSSVTDTISNEGLISGGDGINVSGYSSVGSITNTGGYIGGYSDNGGNGINVSGYSSIGSITNTGGYIGGYSDNGGNGINVSGGSTVSSITNTGGYISGDGYYGGTGINVSGTGSSVGSITNTGGDIVGSGYYGGDGIKVSRGGTVGSITNDINGTIEGYGYYGGYEGAGISVVGGGSITGDITNSGDIIGSFAGILAQGDGKFDGTIDGNIINETNGLIDGQAMGVGAIYGGTINGDISNSGTISGSYAGLAAAYAGNITGAITNSGSISGDIGILAANGTISGPITNTTDGFVDGNMAGIYVTNSGSIDAGIDNSGTISGKYGIYVDSSSTITGDIINSGVIEGYYGYGYGAGIQVSDSGSVGSITNSGDIIGEDIGILIEDNGKFIGTVDGNIVNEAGGLISGQRVGIEAEGAITGSILNAGTISGSSAAVRLSGTSPVTITNTGLLDGNIYLNDGTLNLDGTTARITGAVYDNKLDGTVNINGNFTSENTFSVANFNVANSGTLNMANDITAFNEANNDGVLAVAAGDMVTITGDYTQTANGMFRTGATSASEYGQLVVTGTADLSASNAIDVNVTPADTLANGDVLSSVISAGSLNAGALTVTDDSAIWNFTGVINGNAIDLTTKKGLSFVEAVTGTPAEQPAGGAAGTLDEIMDSGTTSGDMQTVLDAMGAIETKGGVAQAVASTVPVFAGSYSRIAQRVASGDGTRLVQNRARHLRGLSSGDAPFKDSEVWTEVLYSKADQDRDAGVDGYNADSFGIAIGADTEVSPDWRLGAAFTYGQSDVENDGTINKEALDIDTYQVTLYAMGEIAEATNLSLIAAYGYNDNDSSRNIIFGGLNRTAKANFDSWHTYLDAELSRYYKVGEKTTLTPSLQAQYTYVSVDGYTETGAGALNLNVNDDSADSLVAMFRGRMDYAMSGNVNLNGHLGIGYDLMADDSSVTSSFTGGGSTFLTEGIDPEPVVVRGGIGAEVLSSNDLKLTLNYDVEGREDYTKQTVWLNLRVPF